MQTGTVRIKPYAGSSQTGVHSWENGTGIPLYLMYV